MYKYMHDNIHARYVWKYNLVWQTTIMLLGTTMIEEHSFSVFWEQLLNIFTAAYL